MGEMRPTSGKVLQAAFNILGDIDGLAFLDLFSGTGQVALAAEKKRTAFVCLVESDRKRFGEILKNISPKIKCMCMDVRRALPKLARDGHKFDIIFADPPYLLGWGEVLPKLLEENERLLRENGVVVFEHSKSEPTRFEEFWTTEDRAYGSTILTFARRRKEND